MNTLLLDRSLWDLVLDTNNNIAVATNPYSLAQDAASAVKTFRGEVYYDTTLGVPYYQELVGHLPPLSLVKADLVDAVLQVPEVVAAQVYLTDLTERLLSGQIQLEDKLGTITIVGF